MVKQPDLDLVLRPEVGENPTLGHPHPPQIIDHLIQTWKVADLSVTGKAAKAQDYHCRQAEKFERFADEIAASLASQPTVRFAWLDR